MNKNYKGNLSKKKFCKYMEILQEFEDNLTKLDEILGSVISMTTIETNSSYISLIASSITPDEDIQEDIVTELGWFCYEIDFGRKKDDESKKIWYNETELAMISNAEDMYDFIQKYVLDDAREGE